VHHKQWVDKQVTSDARRWDTQAPFDESVLPAVDAALAARGKRAVFVHLMGCHLAYNNRYPASFDAFTANPRQLPERWSKTVNRYDTCVHYNDGIVTNILERVRATGKASATLYFSDHGEEIYDYRDVISHNDTSPSKYMVEIPFVIWLSDGYKTLRRDLARDLQSRVKQPFSLTDLPIVLADLAGVRFPGWIPQHDPIAPQFQPYTRYVGQRQLNTTNCLKGRRFTLRQAFGRRRR